MRYRRKDRRPRRPGQHQARPAITLTEAIIRASLAAIAGAATPRAAIVAAVALAITMLYSRYVDFSD